MPHIKSQFSHTTLFHEPWRTLGHRVCYKCNSPIRVGDWNWTSNTSNGSKYGYTKLPVEHPEKYSHADCAKPASYKQWEDPNKQKANPYATPQPYPPVIQQPEETPVTEPEKPQEAPEEPKPVATPTVDSSIVGWFETNSLDHVQFKDLYRILSSISPVTGKRDLDVYLGGSPGAGKSHAIRECAKRMSLDYAFIALSDATMPSAIFGYQNMEGDFVGTVFYNFYKNGGILDVAELDNTNAGVFTLLNNALDNGHCTFPGRHKGEDFQLILRHENFICVGNGNTFLRGPDKMFPARQRQDAAAIERFVVVNWKYDESLELTLMLDSKPTPKPLPKQPLFEKQISNSTRRAVAIWGQKLRSICTPGGTSVQGEELVVSMRGLKKLMRLMEIGFSSQDSVKMAIFKEYAGTSKLLNLVPLTF